MRCGPDSGRHGRGLRLKFPGDMRNLLILTLFLLLFSFPTHAGRAEQIDIPGGKDFLQGLRLQEAGKWKSSIEPLRKAADIYSFVADYSLNRMAQSALKAGNQDLAVAALEKLIDEYDDSPVRRAGQIQLGTIHFKAGRFTRALPLIQAALPGAQTAEETAALTLMLAKTHLGLNERSKSDSICWQLIYGRPSAPEALEAVGMIQEVDTPQKKLAVAKVYLQNKQPQQALSLLDGLAADQPGVETLMPDVLLVRAQSLAQDGQKKEAAEICQKIAERYPGHSLAPLALFSKADYEKAAGLRQQALSDYSRVVEKFPASSLAPQALWQRAKIFEAGGNPDEYKEYETVLTRYPRSFFAYLSGMTWGVDVYRAGDYKASRTIFERLLSVDQNDDANADALFWMAKSLLAGGDTASARTTFQMLIAKYEESYQAFRARAILRILDQPASAYPQPYSAGWETLFSWESGPFPPREVTGREQALDVLTDSLPEAEKRSLRRLEFLVLNDVPEAKLELEHLALGVRKAEANYALAWTFFQVQAYNDSVRIASSLRTSFADSSRSNQIKYLLYPTAYPGLVGASAFKYEVDPLLVLAMMREESHFLETSVSPSDARGLMQIVPKTGEWLGRQVFGSPGLDTSDLFLPAINIELGNYYLRYLLNKFDNNTLLTVAAYNWGETNLRNWLQTAPKEDFDVFVETIPANETRRYVKKVFKSYAVYRSLYSSGPFIVSEQP